MQAAQAIKNFTPLMDRVLVQRAEAVAKSKGGILIPEKAQSKVIISFGCVIMEIQGNCYRDLRSRETKTIYERLLQLFLGT